MRKTLPVFPLPLVLLPFELLPLHIFEPRYQRMLEVVEAGDGQFGISYFNPQTAFDERPDLGGVGCVAHVRNINRLPDGRADIMTVGVMRYRLIDWVEDAGEPYLIADAETFTDEKEDADVLKPLADECAAVYRRVARATNSMFDSPLKLRAPREDDAEFLSFQMTEAAGLPANLKSEMLRTRSTVERLTKMRGLMQKIAGDLEASADLSRVVKTNGHSKKKIDL